MWAARGSTAARVGGLLLGGALIAGCGAPPAPTGLPSFPEAASATTAATQPAYPGVVPDDCVRLMTPADLGALLGLPLGSVSVRTIVGVPAPSVGQTERIDCTYGLGPGGPPLLSARAMAYADDEAARAQWQRNADVEDGTRKGLPLGAATGLLIERPTEALLTIVYGRATVSLLLPDRPFPGGRSREQVLVDLALRVLPTIAKGAPSASPHPTAVDTPDTGPALPARAAGAS
jgi:hypothetical protein